MINLTSLLVRHCALIVLLGFLRGCLSIEHDLTIVVPAGRRECFHQHIKEKKTLDFEFQVIEGGEMDINFILRSPTNKALATEARKQEGIYTFGTHETGDYLFCFDNSFSRISEKLVYFDLALDYNDDESELKKPAWVAALGSEATTDVLEVRLEEIQTSLDVVRDNMHKSIQHQRLLRNVEFRDRYLAERNYERVTFWSVATSVIMMVTFFIQVIMIRSLFSERVKECSDINTPTHSNSSSEFTKDWKPFNCTGCVGWHNCAQN